LRTDRQTDTSTDNKRRLELGSGASQQTVGFTKVHERAEAAEYSE